MTMCKQDESLSHQKSRLFIASKRVGLSLDIWLLKESLKRFITEYIPEVRVIIS